jgi:hypothetical protein
MHLVKGSRWRQIEESSQEPHHGRPKNHCVRSSSCADVLCESVARWIWQSKIEHIRLCTVCTTEAHCQSQEALRQAAPILISYTRARCSYCIFVL